MWAGVHSTILPLHPQCELQTDRQRLMLHDTATNPLSRLAASDSYDFLLRHDVKEPNDHVLTFRWGIVLLLLHGVYRQGVDCNSCTPRLTASSPLPAVQHTQRRMAAHVQSSRQWSSWPATRSQSAPRCSSPPSCAAVIPDQQRTQSAALCEHLLQIVRAIAWAARRLLCPVQTRMVAGAVFVEVCVENQSTTAPLFLDYVRLEPPPGVGPVQSLSAAAAPSAASAAGGDPAEFLQRHIDSLTIVQPNGAHNLLYRCASCVPCVCRPARDSTKI